VLALKFKFNFLNINNLHVFYFKAVTHEHARTMDENDPRDFLDVYLQEMKKKSNSSFSGNEGSCLSVMFIYNVLFKFYCFYRLVEQLVASIMDMFGAGAESTTNSIGDKIINKIWLMIFGSIFNLIKGSFCCTCCIIPRCRRKCKKNWIPSVVKPFLHLIKGLCKYFVGSLQVKIC
jgi:hypothetical protein